MPGAEFTICPLCRQARVKGRDCPRCYPTIEEEELPPQSGVMIGITVVLVIATLVMFILAASSDH